MKLLILSRNPALYSSRRLAEAAQRLGHRPLVADPLQCRLEVTARGADVSYGRRPLRGVDAAIPRIGTSIWRYGMALVRQLEEMGVPVANGSVGIWNARDRLSSLQALARARIDIPDTAVVQSPGEVAEAVEAVGGAPVVLKLLQGTQGVGVILAETTEAAESTLDALWSLGEAVLIQRFVAEARGRDLRAVVVGGRVVAAMRRIARRGDFRANVHRGGTCEIASLDAETTRLALAATGAMGLTVAGVDLLETSRGPVVLEVNSSPGFEGLEQATGRDVAGAIVEHAVRLASERDGAARPWPGGVGPVPTDLGSPECARLVGAQRP
ncbi:RimK family alpha-L-glutamate ligase [Myxococcota bacterium]|nr:RimK family alpha-L-glutamate ligase [Myxococcota bacterium]